MAGSILSTALAGCLGRPGSSGDGAGERNDGDEHSTGGGDDDGPSEAEIEECALAYIEENVLDPEEKRAEDDVERVEDPNPTVTSTSSRDGRVVYHVSAWWGVDYADEELLRIEAAESEELLGDAPRSDESPLEEATELGERLEEAVATGQVVRFSEFDSGYETAVEAIESAVEKEPDEPVVLDHEGTPITVRIVEEPGIHADYAEDAYYHPVDGEVYRTASEDADPTDGQRIDC